MRAILILAIVQDRSDARLGIEDVRFGLATLAQCYGIGFNGNGICFYVLYSTPVCKIKMSKPPENTIDETLRVQ